MRRLPSGNKAAMGRRAVRLYPVMAGRPPAGDCAQHGFVLACTIHSPVSAKKRLFISALALAALAPAFAQTQVNVTSTGGEGSWNWTDTARWTGLPSDVLFPENSEDHLFNATMNHYANGFVRLGEPDESTGGISIRHLTFVGINLTLNRDLTITQGTALTDTRGFKNVITGSRDFILQSGSFNGLVIEFLGSGKVEIPAGATALEA
jgi:hypothetical protein